MLQVEREVIARTREVSVSWDPGNLTLEVWPAAVRNAGQRAVARPLFAVSGELAKRFGAAIVVTSMREGSAGVARLLREVCEPRGSNIAAGMFRAEVGSYRRVNGMIVRDMEL